MLKIRLRRTGARKRPSYRVVVAESAAPRDGHYIEIIGFYDPLTDPSTVRLDGEKVKLWLGRGAQPTERVTKLLVREGIIQPAPVAAPEPEPEPTRKPSRRRAAEPAATATDAEPAPAAEAEPAAPADEAEPSSA